MLAVQQRFLFVSSFTTTRQVVRGYSQVNILERGGKCKSLDIAVLLASRDVGRLYSLLSLFHGFCWEISRAHTLCVIGPVCCSRDGLSNATLINTTKPDQTPQSSNHTLFKSGVRRASNPPLVCISQSTDSGIFYWQFFLSVTGNRWPKRGVRKHL